LAPCLQFIDLERAFSYRGGCVLAPGAIADRISALGSSVLPSLDGALGFVGIDLVLGNASDGSADVVLEVNPRLTTSYVGLRAAFNGNLGQALLDVAAGIPVPLEFAHVPLEFRADGAVLQPTGSARERDAWRG
jgi:predicted ATP-grasp superfamily ATP-dependent carboligase